MNAGARVSGHKQLELVVQSQLVQFGAKEARLDAEIDHGG
jgi:hypothetical protein